MSYLKKLFNSCELAAKITKSLAIFDLLGIIGWVIIGAIALFIYLLKQFGPMIVVVIGFGVAFLYGLYKFLMAIIEYKKRDKK